MAILHKLDLWEQYWKTFKRDHPNNVSSTLKTLIFPDFENIKTTLRILETLHVTSFECERSCKKLKHYNRSIMKYERLNGLALIQVHKDIELKCK